MDKNEKKNKKILQQIDNEKQKQEEKQRKLDNKKPFKEKIKDFFKLSKEFFIKDTSKMILLVAILLAVYVVVNLWVSSLRIAQIDLTKEKLYTLTDQSKSIAKKIDHDITFYVWQFTEDKDLYGVIDLLKQYNVVNARIKYQIVTTDNVDLIQKYGLDTDYPEIIGYCDSTNRTTYTWSNELTTYDSNFNQINITEQKLTNALMDLNNEKKPKVYFVEGRSNYSTSGGVAYLANYLQDEYYEVEALNIISAETIPEDCDILVIMNTSVDFKENEANLIIDYINKGGDMIITNDIDYENPEKKFPNFQRILDEYAVSLPNQLVADQDKNNQVAGSNILYQVEVSSTHEITKVLHDSYSMSLIPIFMAPGYVELDTEKMAEEMVTAIPILNTSSNSNLVDAKTGNTISSDQQSYVLGAAIQKVSETGDESRAVIYTSTSSFSDQSWDGELAAVAYNSNLILNSFAFAANKGELYSIRKTQEERLYTVTEEQAKIIRTVLTSMPIAISVFGIVIWIKRRRLK